MISSVIAIICAVPMIVSTAVITGAIGSAPDIGRDLERSAPKGLVSGLGRNATRSV